MGTKKRKSTKTTKRKTNSASKSRSSGAVDIDLAVISMVVVGILLFVLIYGETGTVGSVIGPAMGGIIGIIKYIIPIGFFAIGINLMKEKKAYVSSKLFQYALFLGCIAIYEVYSLIKKYRFSKKTDNKFK